MPRKWYDLRASKLRDGMSDEEIAERELNMRIVADRKPYFMRHIYPAVMSEYNTYIKNTKIKCMREFRIELSELLEMDESARTEEQNEFIRYYNSRMPVGVSDCIMNKICRRFEQEFDGFVKLHASKDDFDVSLLKSDEVYTKKQYYAVAKLYDWHNEQLRLHKQIKQKGRADDSDNCEIENMRRVFIEECAKVCSNSVQLCNIVVDLCYQKAGTLQFAWDVCGNEIVDNLLKRNNYTISFPVQNDDGDIEYSGQRFSMIKKRSKYGGDSIE